MPQASYTLKLLGKFCRQLREAAHQFKQ